MEAQASHTRWWFVFQPQLTWHQEDGAPGRELRKKEGAVVLDKETIDILCFLALFKPRWGQIKVCQAGSQVVTYNTDQDQLVQEETCGFHLSRNELPENLKVTPFWPEFNIKILSW